MTTAHLELINFQDPTHKSDFETYYTNKAFNLPKKASGNQKYGCS